ncbi:helix-turn-helix domain-containing protein [Myceligenerans cantabricum]
MDKVLLGQRLARARELARMTQDGLARKVDLDRTAISRLESGERNLSVQELVAVAEAVQRPLSYFVAPALPSVISRRTDTRGSGSAHDTTDVLDVEIEQFAADLRILVELKVLHSPGRANGARTPRTYVQAERMAESVRRQLGLDSGPVLDIGSFAERLGLFTFVAPLGPGGPDGGCVEVEVGGESLGAAVINGDMPSGRRRMTLAHELAHWLTGDAYDAQAPLESEKLLNALAIHLLAPRSGVAWVWNEHDARPVRDRALFVAAEFQVSWSAAIGQLRNLDLITHEQREELSVNEPRAGDYLRLGLNWLEDLAVPSVSPQLASACVNGFADGRLTADRAVELLRGTLTIDDLPSMVGGSREDLRRSFEGHA